LHDVVGSNAMLIGRPFIEGKPLQREY